MRNRVLGFLLCLFSVQITAQGFERVDAVIQLYPETFETAEEFSYLLSRDFETDAEKVRAIYGWLINNVSYHPEEYKKFNYSFKNYRERNKKEEKTRQKIIARTLQTGLAVCEGYAFVLEKLCQLQGIDNYLIRGDTKTHFKDIGRSFKKNHLWNAININGQWQLFDATWGAGTYRDRFYKEPSYFYYAIAPEQLIKSHFPAIIEDAFLETPKPFSEFSKAPLILSNQLLEKNIISPEGGTIHSRSSMNTIYFEIQMESPNEIHFAYGSQKQEVSFEVKNDSIHFVVPVQMGHDSLLIYFDGKPILGYKVT